MMRYAVLSLLLACFTVTHSQSIFGPSSTIELLTDQSLPHLITQSINETTLVMFYTAKSGKSKSAAPELNKIAKSMNGMLRIAAIDCLSYESLCEAESVYHEEAIPIIKVYTGGSVQRFVGDVNAKKLIAFAFNAMPMHSNQLTISQSINRPKHKPRIILFTDKPDLPNMWKALSQRFHQSIDFYNVRQTDSKLIKQFKVDSFPRVIAQSVGSINQSIYDGPMSFKALVEWTSQFHNPDIQSINQSIKLPELIDQSCINMYCLNGKSSLCAILIASHSSPNINQQIDTFAQLEVSRADPVFKHVTLDSDKHQSFINQAFGLQPADYPQIVVLSVKRERYASFVGAFEAEAMSSWLRGVTAGQIRTSRLESDTLPILEGSNDEQLACVPSVEPEIVSAEEPVDDALSHPGDRYIWPINFHNFTHDVLQSRAGWMIMFMSNDDIAEIREPWLDVANKTRHSVRMSVVNVDGEPEFAGMFNITKTPVVYTIRGTAHGKRRLKDFKLFSGELTVEALNKHSLQLLDSSHIFRVRGEDGLSHFMSSPPMAASRILLFTKHTSAITPIFTSLSLDFVDDLVFGVASHNDKALMDKFQVRRVPSLVAIGMLPVENGAMSLIAGNYEHAFAFAELHAWCAHVVVDGVINDGMPAEIREKYREYRKTLEEQSQGTSRDEL